MSKPPLTRSGGRPPKQTWETKTVILDALRAGKSYTAACLAANINPVSLFAWRRAGPRFDAQCRAARATGKKKPHSMPGQWTQIDSYGNIVPSSEIICDAKERERLIKLRNQLLGTDNSAAATGKLQARGGGHSAVVKRLLKFREEYNAEQRKSGDASVEAADGGSKPFLGDPGKLKGGDKAACFSATDNLLALNDLSITSDKTINVKSALPAEIPPGTTPIPALPEPSPPKPTPATPASGSCSRMAGGRSPASRPHVDPDPHNLGSL